MRKYKEKRIDKIFLIISTTFLSIATVGFLVLQGVVEKNIKNKRENNVGFISSQKDVLDSIEKANRYRELAILIEANQSTLKAVNAPNDIFQVQEKNRLDFYRYSVLHTSNAIIASKKWDNAQRDKKLEEINTLTIDQLKDRYKEYAAIAAEGTFDLNKKIDVNWIKILSLEKANDFWWYICFFVQVLGLIFGFWAVKTLKE